MRKQTPTLAIATILALALSPAIFGAGAKDATQPAEVTFARDVLPILQENCQTCHRPGGDNFTGMVAPMSLVTYDEVRPWARSIAKQVESRKMPPWFASPEYHGVFSNERTLTDDEISSIVAWAKSGAPIGDLAEAPAPREFGSKGWRIGEPDLVVTAPRYFVPDDVDTHYTNHQVVLTDDILPASRWVQAIEWKGGASAVHHIVGYAYLPGQKVERGRGYGLGSIAPGEEPMHFPDGFAKLLVKGSTLVFNMHYHKEAGPGTGEWDASQVAFKFYPEGAEVAHFVDHNAIGAAAFEIPPNHPNWKVGAARMIDEDITLISMHPHMHLRGKRARYIAFYPDGSQETILEVPEFDFNWQTDYSFVEPKVIPAGTRLEYTAWFDNSVDNPSNPDANKAQGWGRETWDEMMLGYITYSSTEPKKLTVEEAIAQHLGRRRGGLSE
ncbi:MAG: alkyl hydroperoxide reductase [Acidobacteriota bacterium]|nr:alkyl hydroperoxide reductase [Acidobacteriota bacterium]